tara:strand:- start:3216 stop:4148 length:933 start_codon:yes stop_codon:yes gene_type:complete
MNFLRKDLQWICHHAHLDKSNLISKNNLLQTTVHMKDKWFLMQEYKQNYTKTDLYNRMNTSVQNIVNQNCKHIRSFIDVDSIVGLTCIKAADQLKKDWSGRGVNIQLATQPLEGLAGKDSNIKLFEEAAEICDIVGCLPSRDFNKFEEHLDIAFSTAKRLGKDIEAHLDQCNIPSENETSAFCDFVEKYDYRGKARCVHSISLACQPLDRQEEVAWRLSFLDVGVIICPSAAISMKQASELYAPIHNSIAPLKLLLDAGVGVGLGIDNINDIFMPYCDGNLTFELRLLAEATRTYDIDVLERIATNKLGF